MKKVWKAGIAGLAALSIGAAGFIGTTAAFAAPVNKVITVPAVSAGQTAHTFNVYQIFTGDISADGNTLSNIQWGAQGSEAGSAADAVTALKALTGSDAAKAKEIAKYVKKGADGKFVAPLTTVSSGNTITVPSGYYLLEDTTASTNGDANNIYIVTVNGDTEIKPKNETVTSSKNVKDKNDTEGTTTEWQDGADHDINDEIEYRLVFNLPANYSDFESYMLNFVDDMGYGLTYKANSSKIKVGSGEATAIADPTNVTGQNKTGSTTEQYTSSYDHATDSNLKGTVWKWSFNDTKKNELFAEASNSAVVELTYTATLNENAVLGSVGNPNKFHAEYTNDFYNEDSYGTTPDDVNKVFTYELSVSKVDKDKNPLFNGAGFTLYKKTTTEALNNQLPVGAPAGSIAYDNYVWQPTGTEQKVDATENGQAAEGKTNIAHFKGIDDGTYLLRETFTPDGYNTAEDVIFTLTANHEVTSADPTLESVTTNNPNVTMVEGSMNIATSVVNNKGSELPETGGMGTTMLYVAGGAIVLIAGIGMAVALRRRQA